MTLKKIVFIILPLVVVLLAAELLLRGYYYHKHSGQGCAVIHALKHAQNSIGRKRAEKRMSEFFENHGLCSADKPCEYKAAYRTIQQELFSERGTEVRQYFFNEYKARFKELVDECKSVKSRLVLLYIPTDGKDQWAVEKREKCRQFFLELAREHDLDYIDVTVVFKDYPEEWLTLLPLDDHLSRFGGQLVAGELSGYLRLFKDYRSNYSFDKRPEVMGDLAPRMNKVLRWQEDPGTYFRVLSNAQGFRMDKDIQFPADKQRILMLGDSYTFGPYLPNRDTFPSILARQRDGIEVINAGMPGYTILQQLELFQERARFCEPDITILQVVDNDIPGFFFFEQNEYGREGAELVEPGPLEKKFFAGIRDKS